MMTDKKPVILALTDDYLVIHKKAGVSFHDESGGSSETGLMQILREMEASGEISPGPRLYPVHRLDRITSGVMIFARGRNNANLISNEFRHGRAQKIYIALSDRTPSKKQGLIVGDMVKSRRGLWMLTRTKNNPAITRFISEPVPNRRARLRLFVLHPKTGKTHQLRVAMKSIGSPILGDGQYGRFDQARQEDRAYLHAYSLRIRLGNSDKIFRVMPDSGEEFLNEDFGRTLKSLGNPYDLFSTPASREDQNRKP